MTSESEDLDEIMTSEIHDANQVEDLVMVLESVMDTITMATIRQGVFREGEFTADRWGVKMNNILFDTGALQTSYVNSEIVEANREKWAKAISPLNTVVKMADQQTKVKTSEKITGRITFVDDKGIDKSGIVEAIVWKMPNLDFILGLPDVLKNFLPLFAQMLNDAQNSVAQVTTESEDTVINENPELLKPFEKILWSNGETIEAPEDAETPMPSHFDPVLQFMEIPYDEAMKEYHDILDKHIGEKLKDSVEFRKLLTSKLALGRFVPVKWEGITCPPLHLKVRDNFPLSHKIQSRPINPRMYQHTKKEFDRLMQYMYKPSTSQWASPLVVAPKATEPFIRFCGDYRWFNAFCELPQAYIPRVQYEIEKAMGFQIFVDIDMTNSFHQFILTSKTSEMLAVQTPWGLVQPNFLPEGVSPASGHL